MNVRVVHARVELQLGFNRRADISGLAHFPDFLPERIWRRICRLFESTLQSRDGKGDGGSRDIGPR
jgi:hypothetical protein